MNYGLNVYGVACCHSYGAGVAALQRIVCHIDFLQWTQEESGQPRTFIAINSHEHFGSALRSLRINNHTIRVCQSDMGAMYTSLKQETVIANVTEMYRMAFQQAATSLNCTLAEVRVNLDLQQSKKRKRKLHASIWTIGGTGYSFEIFIRFMTLSVTCALVKVGDEIRLQSAGIGMGTPSSPEIATLACAYPEIVHFLSLSADVRTHDFSVRYIDDMISDERRPAPTATQYDVKDVISKNGLSKAEFLGLQSTFSPTVTFNIVDKKSDTARFPGGICRYPHWYSNIPQHFCTSSIIGSLSYALSNSSSWSRFITAGRNFMEEFKTKGYPLRLIHSTVHRFATIHLENTRVSPRSLTVQLLEKQHTPSRVGFGTMLPPFPSAMKQSFTKRLPPGTSISFTIPPSNTSILRKPHYHTSVAQQREHRRMNHQEWMSTSPAPPAPPAPLAQPPTRPPPPGPPPIGVSPYTQARPPRLQLPSTWPLLPTRPRPPIPVTTNTASAESDVLNDRTN